MVSTRRVPRTVYSKDKEGFTICPLLNRGSFKAESESRRSPSTHSRLSSPPALLPSAEPASTQPTPSPPAPRRLLSSCSVACSAQSCGLSAAR